VPISLPPSALPTLSLTSSGLVEYDGVALEIEIPEEIRGQLAFKAAV
jgi:hypothetical protein